MTQAADPNATLPRILIVAPPKSASSYVANVVRRYFQIEEHPFSNEIDWDSEHNLTPAVYTLLHGQSFCFNFHMLAHRMNLEVARREHIGLLGIWRNLGDMLLSLSEYVAIDRENGPMYFIRDHDKYRARPLDEQHAWLIDTVIPWYLTFYLRWRSVNLALHPYEHMLRDRYGYFAGMLEPLLTHPPVTELLEASLGAPVSSADRKNVGRAGRSARSLSEANRRRLEEKILLHPDCAQLEILLWELPWTVPDLEPLVPLDGHVVRTVDDETIYFVSRGKRYPVPHRSWLLGRFGDRRTPRIVPTETLRPYPIGEPLD